MTQVVWPMGMERELGTRPLVFNPEGFLVALLEDDAACERGHAGLLGAGFPVEHLRLYTSQQILDDHDRYLAARSKLRRVVATATDDQATIELYFGAARAGRGALWVYAADKRDATRAMRVLADHAVVHYRYFGRDLDYDLPVGGGRS